MLRRCDLNSIIQTWASPSKKTEQWKRLKENIFSFLRINMKLNGVQRNKKKAIFLIKPSYSELDSHYSGQFVAEV